MASAAFWRSEYGIPIRNLWFLLVHASDLAALLGPGVGSMDEHAELPDLLGVLLAEAVERRLRRGLGRGYVGKTAPLTRVRGRIDWLATESGRELMRGRVTCRYQDFTFDRPRNRLARAALVALSTRVEKRALAGHLRDLDRALVAWGVQSNRPSTSSLLADFPGRQEADDRLMVEVAQLALDLVLPSEADNRTPLMALSHDEKLLRRIFEAGVAGYLRYHLHGKDGWRVRAQRSLSWQIEAGTDGVFPVLPGMIADIVLERADRRIVVDTKFSAMLVPRQHGGESLKSAHIYQLYSYLRSQEGTSPQADGAEGLLLYPAIGVDRNEVVNVQGHRLRFATLDLAQDSSALGKAITRTVCG